MADVIMVGERVANISTTQYRLLELIQFSYMRLGTDQRRCLRIEIEKIMCVVLLPNLKHRLSSSIQYAATLFANSDTKFHRLESRILNSRFSKAC
ncbi:hypothetical protein AVEN_4780-1 [Araneus ventricosus]|uniref:Uncharacterized protein n=1 Tax=Araneus ventricosus TaxID=182803 RepID=A0A4Y2JQA6_ARAVE|nr:hypothetical protein AVEN_4780-1 [Araneus ventricosus]